MLECRIDVMKACAALWFQKQVLEAIGVGALAE
jgi:hypothetical protein